MSDVMVRLLDGLIDLKAAYDRLPGNVQAVISVGLLVGCILLASRVDSPKFY